MQHPVQHPVPHPLAQQACWWLLQRATDPVAPPAARATDLLDAHPCANVTTASRLREALVPADGCYLRCSGANGGEGSTFQREDQRLHRGF